MITEELPLKKPKQKRRYVATEARKAQQAKYLKSGYHGPKGLNGRPKQNAEVVGRIRESATEILDTLFSLMREASTAGSDGHLTPWPQQYNGNIILSTPNPSE